ncbi:MAG: mevalonate kinase [Bacteroidota bacterium]
MKKYNSKILLFGEHTINKDSQALAVPLPNFYGKWAYAADNVEKKQMNLKAFAHFLQKEKNVDELLEDLDVAAFSNELENGLYFQSSIPTGYGVGSSGALCAAVYDTFWEKKLTKNSVNFLTLKKILAAMESFFHGSSSGTDPLICYLSKPMLLESPNKIKVVNYNQLEQFQFFLLDTKMPRETSPFVHLFLEKCRNQDYFNRIQAEFNPVVDEAIAAFLSASEDLLFESFHEISHFQFRYFSEMIPVDFRQVWLDGLASNHFKLKLCGAGGGGFILGLTSDFDKIRSEIDFELTAIL